MKRLILIVMMVAFALAPYAQQRKTVQKKHASTTQTQRKTTQQRPQQGKKQQSGKGKKTQQTKKKSKGNKQSYSTPEIRGLQSQRSQIQKNIKEQEQKLQANKTDVQNRLKNLVQLNTSATSKTLRVRLPQSTAAWTCCARNLRRLRSSCRSVRTNTSSR